MKSPSPTVIDFMKLKAEVIDKDPAAALPSNLSTEWLEQLDVSLELILCNLGRGADGHLAAPLALVVRLLFARSPTLAVEVSENQLFRYIQDYYVEISIELLNRRTNIRTTSATMETIFTNRLARSSLFKS